MVLRTITKKLSSQRIRRRFSSSSESRSFSQLQSKSSYGIAFDIDGVLLLGNTPIGGSVRALRRLYEDDGGGVTESKRASDLSRLLGVDIMPSQVIQGHTPFKKLARRFENDLVVAAGKGEPAEVMYEYGFKNAVSIDEYASCFDNIDPIAPYKIWGVRHADQKAAFQKILKKSDITSQKVKATFIVSDPVDWSRDIQVLCDILRTGGLPGRELAKQPPLYFANDDLEYQAAFPSERLGMGAFRIALQSIYNSIHPVGLEYTSYGKPNPFVFQNAVSVLRELSLPNVAGDAEAHQFKKLYMVGDNPSVDINGARKAGHPWFSILTRTGVFKGKDNHPQHPADLVVDTVEEAVDYILSKETKS